MEEVKPNITIEYKDAYNYPLQGDFEFIPRLAVMAIVKEQIDENHKNIYRILFGIPVVPTDGVVTLSNYIYLANFNIQSDNKGVIVVGNMCKENYFIFPYPTDKICFTREAFVEEIKEAKRAFDDVKKMSLKK